MPHPIYGPPSHDLEKLELSLWLPTTRNGRHTRLTVLGTCETKRGPLWTYSEAWQAHEVTNGFQPADAVNLLTLAALQDRPSSQEALQRSLAPGAYHEEPELPF